MALDTLQSIIDNKLPLINIRKNPASGGGANVWRSSWNQGGYPAAPTVSSTTAGGVVLNKAAGGIPFNTPVSGVTKIVRMNITVGGFNGMAMLVDRLWETGANSSGTALDPTTVSTQTINSTTWPARDNNNSTNGEGIYIAIELLTTTTGTTTDATISYTNSSGTSGRTGTTVFTTGGSNGVFTPFSLEAGDVGVRSIQSLTMSTTNITAGTMALVAFRPLLMFPQRPPRQAFVDCVSHPLPPLHDDSTLMFLQFSVGSSSFDIGAEIILSQG